MRRRRPVRCAPADSRHLPEIDARAVIYRVRRGQGGSAKNLVAMARFAGLRVDDLLADCGQSEGK